MSRWTEADLAALQQETFWRGRAEIELLPGKPPVLLDLDAVWLDNPLLGDALGVVREGREAAAAIEAAPSDAATTAQAKLRRNAQVFDWYDQLCAACILDPPYVPLATLRGDSPPVGLTLYTLLATPGAIGKLVDAVFPEDILGPLRSFRSAPPGAPAVPDGGDLRDPTERDTLPDGAAAGAAVVRRGRVGGRTGRRAPGPGSSATTDRTPHAARGQPG